MRTALAAALAAAMLAGSLPALADPAPRWPVCGQWREVPVPGDELYPGGFGNVRDVDVVSPTEAWLVSDFGYESFNEGHVYRWAGVRWEEVPFPAPRTGAVESWVLDDIEVVSPTEAWVVGSRRIDTGVTRPIVGRWDGVRWRLVRLDLRRPISGVLSGIVHVPGTDDLIAVGTWSRRAHPRAGELSALILRWTGSRWQRVGGTDVGRWSSLEDVVVAGSTAWAIGEGERAGDGETRLLALRRAPSGWLPRWGPRGSVRAADAGPAASVWAAGSTTVRDREVGLLARLDPSTGWRAAHRFGAVDVLDDVVAPAPHLVWAVGSSFVRRWNAPRGLVVRSADRGWRVDRRSRGPGYLSAIGGTPHNLWTFLSYPPVEFAELWRFTSFHRC